MFTCAEFIRKIELQIALVMILLFYVEKNDGAPISALISSLSRLIGVLNIINSSFGRW